MQLEQISHQEASPMIALYCLCDLPQPQIPLLLRPVPLYKPQITQNSVLGAYSGFSVLGG